MEWIFYMYTCMYMYMYMYICIHVYLQLIADWGIVPITRIPHDAKM